MLIVCTLAANLDEFGYILGGFKQDCLPVIFNFKLYGEQDSFSQIFNDLDTDFKTLKNFATQREIFANVWMNEAFENLVCTNFDNGNAFLNDEYYYDSTFDSQMLEQLVTDGYLNFCKINIAYMNEVFKESNPPPEITDMSKFTKACRIYKEQIPLYLLQNNRNEVQTNFSRVVKFRNELKQLVTLPDKIDKLEGLFICKFTGYKQVFF